eukprot:9492127-Pyramimonas_sp.AAC.1
MPRRTMKSIRLPPFLMAQSTITAFWASLFVSWALHVEQRTLNVRSAGRGSRSNPELLIA